MEDHGHLAPHGTPDQDESWLDDAPDRRDAAPEGMGMGEDDAPDQWDSTAEEDEFWLDDAPDRWDDAAEGLGMGEDEDGRW